MTPRDLHQTIRNLDAPKNTRPTDLRETVVPTTLVESGAEG